MVCATPEFHRPRRPISAGVPPAFVRWATNKAIRLAIEPPLVSNPDGSSLKPTIEPSHRTTASSTSVAAGPERHEVTFELSAEATRSAKTPIGFAGEATYP